jgi:hypothetical protein
MHETTAPEPERGRAHTRLLADLQRLAALDPERPTAGERLREALGPDLSDKLLFAFASGGARRAYVAAA